MKTKFSEIDSLINILINRLFDSKAIFQSSIVRDSEGESLLFEWTVNGWQGELAIKREKGELTAKELGGVLKLLKEINHDSVTKIQ